MTGTQLSNVKALYPFWLTYQPPPLRDVRVLIDDFETVAAMNKERWDRIEILAAGDRRDRCLADLLASYPDNEPAPVTCCPLMTRLFRIWWVSQMLKVFAEFDSAHMLHLILPEEAVPFGYLHTVASGKIKLRVRRQIERLVEHAIGRRVPVMGGLEVHANYERRVWVVHLHLTIANCEPREIEPLREHYMPRNGWKGLMMVESVENRPRQFAYAQKFFDLRRPFEQEGPNRPNGFRLYRPEHNEHMRYLARHAPTDLTFVMNASRAKGRHFRLNPEVLGA